VNHSSIFVFYFYNKSITERFPSDFETHHIPKVVGSLPTVVKHIFQARPVWIFTQCNITSNIIIYVQFCSLKDKLALSKDQNLQRGGNMFRSGTLLLIFTSTAYLVLETNDLAAPKIQYTHGVSQYLIAR
jgi:hypothetical protein